LLGEGGELKLNNQQIKPFAEQGRIKPAQKL